MVESGILLCKQLIADQDVIREQSGARRDAQKGTLEETFELFHTEDILHIVTRQTERQIRCGENGMTAIQT